MPTRTARALLLFVALTLMAVLPATPAAAALMGTPPAQVAAQADPTDSPASPGASPAASPTGTPRQGRVERLQGQVRQDREGVPGVSISVEGEGFAQTVQTDDEGRWRVELPRPGRYTVTLDEGTLPEGATLRNPDRNPLQLEVGGGQQRSALFPLGEDTREVAGTADRLAQSAASGLRFGLLLALASVGLSLIFGTTGLTNFAHGELVTLGGLMAYFFSVAVGLPFLLAALATMIVAGAAGYVVDQGLWAQLRRRGTGLLAMMIVSIGLAILVRYFFLYIFGGQTRGLATESWLNQVLAFGPVRYRVLDLVSMGICVLAIAGVGYGLLRTRLGKATRAVADNPALASATGIDVERVIRVVWIAGAALAGLSGVLLGGFQQVNFSMGFQLLLLMFAAVTLGGLGTAFGALVGALVVGLLVEMSVLVLPPELKTVAALAILIVVLLIRPQGILGRRERIG